MQFSEQDIIARFSERERMVNKQIIARGVRDRRVLEAMRHTPRHLFIGAEHQPDAYEDHPVPIACNQTVSQPYMVAAMTELLGLRGAERVLEIGTGVGYQTAILARLARHVVSIERHALLADAARQRLAALGHDNVDIIIGDGTLGCPERGPYDAILVTAGAPAPPQALREQLADGGRLLVPSGDASAQRLVIIQRHGDAFDRQEGMACRFVPLIGAQGWPEKST